MKTAIMFMVMVIIIISLQPGKCKNHNTHFHIVFLWIRLNKNKKKSNLSPNNSQRVHMVTLNMALLENDKYYNRFVKKREMYYDSNNGRILNRIFKYSIHDPTKLFVDSHLWQIPIYCKIPIYGKYDVIPSLSHIYCRFFFNPN